MTKSAWLFLCLTLATGIFGLSANTESEQTTSLIAAGVCASLLLLTLIVGRRIKFDPVLR